MKTVTREDDISVLEMSVRVTNCMNRAGIHTVGAFLDYPEDQFLDIRNLGKTSLDEILLLREELRKRVGTRFRLMEHMDEPQEYPADEEHTEKSSAPVLLYDTPITKMNLSVRAMNCLNSAGWTMASQLVGRSIEDFLAIKNMGQKTAREIMDAVSLLSVELSAPPPENETPSFVKALFSLAEDLASLFGGTPGAWATTLESLTDGSAFDRDAVIRQVLSGQKLQEAQKKAICDYLEANEDTASVSEIVDYMKSRLAEETLTFAWLDELSNEEKITVSGSTVSRIYPSALEYAESLTDDRQREVLVARLDGKTLEEVAADYNLTRERVRQIQAKAIRNRPKLREDKYRYAFNTYYFSKEDFRLAFDESDSAFCYLEIVTGRKQSDTMPLADALNDEQLSVTMRRQIERAVYKQYVTIDGVRVLKRRPEIVRHVVSRYCREQTDYADFLALYGMVLEELGLSGDSTLELSDRTYENRLNACDYVLWAHGRRLRYYPISEHDYSELIEIVASDTYQNTELTARLFFRNYPELMQELDIRDEYELHNLLRKIWPEENDQVRFGKNPTMTIGTANRDEQVLDLLLQYAPISAQDLAAKMEELYGFDPATSMGSYFNSFRDYYHNGIYTISTSALPPDRFSAMQSLLTGDYYSVVEVQRQYLKQFPSAQRSDINPYTLHTLGFHVYSGYVVSRRFASASDYFNRLLTDKDITNLDEISREVQNIGAFSSILLHLRQLRELIEYEPHQLIHIRRLESGGVTKDTLAEYCDSVLLWLGENRLFTIRSLRRAGFSHELDDLGFDDWFYASLLCEDPRFSSRRMGGTRLLHSGSAAISLEDLLTEILLEREKVEIYELERHLEEEYGICFPKDKLVWLIKESSLYYDGIMETVYIDYDTYFEEI